MLSLFFLGRKEIAHLLVIRGDKQHEIEVVVKRAGYKNVSKFMTAFEKSCRLLEEYQAEHPEEKRPGEKESVISKLKSYQKEAKITPRSNPEKQKKMDAER